VIATRISSRRLRRGAPRRGVRSWPASALVPCQRCRRVFGWYEPGQGPRNPLVEALLDEGPNRPRGVRRSDVAEITSQSAPSGPTRAGHRCRGPVHTPEERLMALHSRSQPQRIDGFVQTRPHESPPAQPAVGQPPGVNSGRRPGLLDVGLPCQGPRSELSPPISYDMRGTPGYPPGSARLGSATLTRSHPLTTGTMCWRPRERCAGGDPTR
jgi:hypothetical protein